MPDKPPPRFAPEGARMKRADWLPEGSQADRQKRTYLDKIGDLESQIRGLSDIVRLRDAQISQLSNELDHRIRELGEAKDRFIRLSADFDALTENRKGDVGRIDAGHASIAAISAERDSTQRALNTLQRQHDELKTLETKQTTALARERKIAARSNAKLISVAVLGVVGTIWGSLGNPVPWHRSKDGAPAAPAKTSEEVAAENVAKPRIACVLKERARSIGRNDPQVHSAPWLPGDPLAVIQTRDVANPPQINSVRLSDVSIIRPYEGSNGMEVSGKLTNLGRDTVSSMTANVFLMNTLNTGDCQPLYSQALSSYFYVPPGTSKRFSIKFDVPSDTSPFSGENAFLTDVKIAF